MKHETQYLNALQPHRRIYIENMGKWTKGCIIHAIKVECVKIWCEGWFIFQSYYLLGSMVGKTF